MIVARLAQPTSSKVTWVHASVRGRRAGRQHDAGSMQVGCAHVIGVLDVVRQQFGPWHHWNRVPWGPRRPAVRQATVKRLADQAVCGTSISDRKVVPSVHIRCRITLMRRARATMARFAPRRRATCTAYVLSHVAPPRCIMVHIPSVGNPPIFTGAWS